MAFYSGFFNSKGLDRTYTAEDFTTYLSSIICNGILDTYGDCFSLTAASTGLKVILGRGKAWINGHYFVNDSRYSIDLTEYQDESLPRCSERENRSYHHKECEPFCSKYRGFSFYDTKTERT